MDYASWPAVSSSRDRRSCGCGCASRSSMTSRPRRCTRARRRRLGQRRQRGARLPPLRVHQHRAHRPPRARAGGRVGLPGRRRHVRARAAWGSPRACSGTRAAGSARAAQTLLVRPSAVRSRRRLGGRARPHATSIRPPGPASRMSPDADVVRRIPAFPRPSDHSSPPSTGRARTRNSSASRHSSAGARGPGRSHTAATSGVAQAPNRPSAPSTSSRVAVGVPPAASTAARQSSYGARPSTTAPADRERRTRRLPAARSKSAPSASTGPCEPNAILSGRGRARARSRAPGRAARRRGPAPPLDEDRLAQAAQERARVGLLRNRLHGQPGRMRGRRRLAPMTPRGSTPACRSRGARLEPLARVRSPRRPARR